MNDDVLSGIRVLDFTAMMSGPYCTRLMADLGAEVIKVEPPVGDHVRTRPPLRDGRSTYFGQLNCGKKSISLDLKRRKAIEILSQLVPKCDVLVENFRPGVMQRLGLGYETLSRVNTKLVYCSISGFGQDGAWAERSAYAPVLHAASGFDMANLGYQDNRDQPLKTGLFVADVLGGALAFGGIQAALFRALRTGRGEWVDLSMMDAMLGLQVYECQEAQFPSDWKRPLYAPTRAKDGFVLIAPTSQNNFRDMARAVGHPEWISNALFETIDARADNWSVLMRLLDVWALDRTAKDCEDVLVAAGVPCSRYYSVAEAMQLPPVADRDGLTTIIDGSGPFKVTNPAFRFRTGTHCRARNGVADLGEHGAKLLRELLDYDDQRIAELLRDGVLHHI
jgi:CoA:oxalate CoA-transferase